MESEGRPVFVLRGEVPLWRVIGPESVGADVAALRGALDQLGIEAGKHGSTAFDAALSAAIAALYRGAGYDPPADADASGEKATEAKTALKQAKAAHTTAVLALAQASKASPDAAAEKVAGDNAVAAARRALAKAKKRGGGDAVREAEEALRLAKAQRAALDAPKDVSLERAAEAGAAEALREARTAYNQARQNTAGPRDILMIPTSPVRVDQVLAKIGQLAEGPVITWTQTTLFASANLTDTQRASLAAGVEASVSLPNGLEVAGTVGDITAPHVDQESGQSTPATVRIDIEDQEALADVGLSAATIRFVREEATGALVVPVTALIALAEGGYAVELTDGTLVGVELGLVADTRAEIVSDQLSVGQKVVVP
jgi:hypothetical protein